MKVFFTGCGCMRLTFCKPGGVGLDSRPILCQASPSSCTSSSDMNFDGVGVASQTGQQSTSCTSGSMPSCSWTVGRRLGVCAPNRFSFPADAEPFWGDGVKSIVRSSSALDGLGEEKHVSAFTFAGVSRPPLLTGFGDENRSSLDSSNFAFSTSKQFSLVFTDKAGRGAGELVQSSASAALGGRGGGVCARASHGMAGGLLK
mmetsp:Transcript_29095/g.46674  ORF Transcript_29095/g.46674 Transcript_29095/m.46674 type:complete len:202 (-) Transcript_29095:3-608(-)